MMLVELFYIMVRFFYYYYCKNSTRNLFWKLTQCVKELDTKTKIHFGIDCQKMGFYNQWFIKFIDITYKKKNIWSTVHFYTKKVHV